MSRRIVNLCSMALSRETLLFSRDLSRTYDTCGKSIDVDSSSFYRSRARWNRDAVLRFHGAGLIRDVISRETRFNFVKPDFALIPTVVYTSHRHASRFSSRNGNGISSEAQDLAPQSNTKYRT